LFLNIPPPIDYVDPWLTSYESRMRQLCDQPRRIAYFYERADTSTFRYRVFNPGLTLAANPGAQVSGAWFDRSDLSADDGFIVEADALVICRARYNSAVAQMISRARAIGIPVLFDCDDLVFDTSRLHLLLDSLNLNQRDEAVWNDWFAKVSRTGAVLRLCDAFVTTNEYLAERAKEYQPELRTAIMPNYLNPQQQALSESLYNAKRNSGWARDGRIHVGYFSGSPSHARDFAIVAPAIARLIRTDPRVVLRVVGFFDPHPQLAALKDRIEVVPLQDFINLQRSIAEVEINIAPLQDNVFTNCKSDLKFFEAAICGTLTLASPTFAFRKAIKHGRTGFLVAPHEWDDALRQAVTLAEDRTGYEAIAEAAFAEARGAYGWDMQAKTILRAVFGWAEDRRPPLKPNGKSRQSAGQTR
jgi:glycosyltransferase involved in cell wall biosynthesis